MMQEMICGTHQEVERQWISSHNTVQKIEVGFNYARDWCQQTCSIQPRRELPVLEKIAAFMNI
jgi:hypothetical protein